MSNKGKGREYSVRNQLRGLGYRATLVSRSGQRVSQSSKDHGIPGDIIAWSRKAGWPHLLVEVGGPGKRIGSSFRELLAEPLPGGYCPMVARVIGRRWQYWTSPSDKHLDLEEALASYGE